MLNGRPQRLLLNLLGLHNEEENYAGKFPLWLSPVQVTVLPISDKHHDYAQNVCKQLHNNQTLYNTKFQMRYIKR